MGRRRRPDLPGTVFHITARTIRYEGWFTVPVRNAVVRTVAAVVPGSRVRLLALAVMPNHLHLVVQQGPKRLSELMQPLLQRIALQVHRVHGVAGPVFWQRYGCRACLDPSYVRNTIVYTHLNPVRAGLCDDPSHYPWSTHAFYAAPGGGEEWRRSRTDLLRSTLDPLVALPLFATGPQRNVDELRSDYGAFVARRILLDEGGGPAGDDSACDFGSLSPLFHESPPDRTVSTPRWPPPYAPDLSDVVRDVLGVVAPGVTAGQLRGRLRGRAWIRLRHHLIHRLHAAGFRSCSIARYFDIADTTVAWVLRRTSPAPPKTTFPPL